MIAGGAGAFAALAGVLAATVVVLVLLVLRPRLGLIAACAGLALLFGPLAWSQATYRIEMTRAGVSHLRTGPGGTWSVALPPDGSLRLAHPDWSGDPRSATLRFEAELRGKVVSLTPSAIVDPGTHVGPRPACFGPPGPTGLRPLDPALCPEHSAPDSLIIAGRWMTPEGVEAPAVLTGYRSGAPGTFSEMVLTWRGLGVSAWIGVEPVADWPLWHDAVVALLEAGFDVRRSD